MDSEPSHQNTNHSGDSTTTTTPMMFYPHAPPLPGPGESISPPPPRNPCDSPSSQLRVTSPSPLSSIHSDPEPDDLELVYLSPSPYPLPPLFPTLTPPYDIIPTNHRQPQSQCTHHSNASPTYCFDCDLIHYPGECDGVFGLSKRSGLWLWFVMKWIRSLVGVKRGRVAGEDSAFVQVVGVREVGYRWVGGGEVAWGAVRGR
ncbi:hypothetical protein HOY80DRAFT_1024484 [Tuber brumale]|nr:hypothetical protein HOY80DRAFT_1024484 [Tuber brumale]